MKFFISFMLLAGLVGAGGGWIAWKMGYFQPPGESVHFIVQKGENFSGIAKRLEQAGIIQNERVLRWYVNYLAPNKKLKRGEFSLYAKMPVPELVRALSEGKPLEYKFTIPEGMNLFQIAEALEEKGFCKRGEFLAVTRLPEIIQLIPGVTNGASPPSSIEGYVFPDTYLLQKVFSPKEIAQLFVQQFREKFRSVESELQSSTTVKEFRLSPHQVVTFASIVEKETGAASERPLVASIFVNRLRKRMRLQTDPTVIYGVWLANGTWDGNIHRRDLDTPTPYNTYHIYGLPPGPIANPGLSAIRAVLQPAESEYLYFVSKGDGTHMFSKDYGNHQRAVKDTQLKPGAKDGKSWRNLPAADRANK